MSRFRKALLCTVLGMGLAGPAAAEKLGLGRPALPEEITAWDIDVRPDGTGLPEGSGDVTMGEELFSENCAVCHGDFGEAVGRWPVLAGGQGTLNRDDPVKTVGSYWPYLSTVVDYVHRAMPFGNAQSLTPDEVYAVVAYILYLNDIVDEDFTLSKDTFAEVQMPNADGFLMDDRDSGEVVEFSAAPCMENCKDSVVITMHASVLDVTPEETAARKQAESETEALVAMVAITAEPAATAVPAEVAAPDPALVAAGAKVFKKCSACHKIGEGARNATGPELNGIEGRVAGTAEGFKYSAPMLAAGADGLVWTDQTLDRYLTSPKTFVKGTKMTFTGLTKEADRRAVIAYLASFGP